MSIWRFTLVDRDGKETVIDDPQGWSDIEVNIERDDEAHGIFFNYPIDTLQFHGEGAALIKGEYDIYGVDGFMSLRIEFQCSDGETFDEFYFGRLAFDEYDDECGDLCIVNVGLQESNDIMLLRNNMEQKVNLYSNKAFDETTNLTNYTRLNIDIQLPPRGLTERSDALSTEDIKIDFFVDFPAQWNHMSVSNFDFEHGSFPILFGQNDIGNTEIGISGTTFGQAPFYYRFGDPGDMLELLTIPGSAGQLSCSPKDFLVAIKAAGTLAWVGFNDIHYKLRISVKAGPDKDNARDLLTFPLIDVQDNNAGNATYSIETFDYITIFPGELLWIYYYVEAYKIGLTGSMLSSLIHTQNTGSYINLKQTSVCESTTAKVSYVNEAISRTVEAITNDRIRFYSTTFGRIDSQPYALPNDTCAGLFAISNGLNIRRKLLADNTQPGFFVTLRQLFDDLNSIWNIGFEIEPDINRPGFNRLRFENWRYFYQDEIGLVFNYATSVKRAVDTNRLYNRMITGFNKWEAGEITGLDELMTQRTYRININAISKELNVATDMICSPYTIEITRRKDTTTEDFTYDNDIFGFCLLRDGANFRIETFKDTSFNVENVNDPDSNYNARITPARNAMRWFNFIMMAYRTFSNNTRLIFSSGTGNYIAKLGLNNCNIEGKILAENENIELEDFLDVNDAQPFLFPEILTFEHPMNYNTFLKLKNDPTLKRKSIIVKCNDNEIAAWIKSIKYKPEAGQATIEAYPKNATQLPEPEVCQATIVPGSVTMTNFDFDAGTAVIDFTEGNPGAVMWTYIVTKGGTPGVGEGFSGATNAHPFTVSGIEPGQWSVFIVPYCNETDVGLNYGSGTFDMPPPPFGIEIEAYLTTGRQQNKLVLNIKTSNGAPAPVSISFKWGDCSYNNSASFLYCVSYPGSPIPLPDNTAVLNAGQTNASFESSQVHPGANFGYIQKIVVYDLANITQSQISKASPGNPWTLEFL